MSLPRLTLASLALALGGCSMLPALPSLPQLPALVSGETFLGLVTPYRIDVVQGNVVTQEMAQRVRPGMTRAQVRDVLGTPMVADLFHVDRWDYVFTFKRPRQAEQRRSVVAHFDGNVLTRLEAPALPAERDFVAAISSVRPSGRQPVLALTAEQLAALPAPVKPTGDATGTAQGQPLGAARPYPPLEPE
ncbi:MAG: outer membrane protein assembly factor BamE [Aquabacterium sp.]